MFHTQSLFDRKMFLKMDRNNSNKSKEKLPDGQFSMKLFEWFRVYKQLPEEKGVF